MIALEKLFPSDTNPRQSFNGLDELGKSLQKRQIQAILVRDHPKHTGKFEIIVGERRYRAAKKVGMETLEASVKKLTDLEVRELQHIENIQREDVSDLDSAKSFAALQKLDPEKYTIDGLAAAFDISRRSVYAILQLAKLDKGIQKLLQDGVIDSSHAIVIAPLSEEQQAQFAKEFARQDKDRGVMSVRDLKQWIGQKIMRDLKTAPFSMKDETLPRFDNKKGAACTTCPFNTGVNRDAYPDEKADRCMNRDCYEHKLTVFLDRKHMELTAEAKKAGKKVIRLVGNGTDYTDRQALKKTGALESYDVRKVKSNAAGATQALVISGEGRGSVRWVSTDPHDTTDARGRHMPSPAERASNAAARTKQVIQSRTERTVLLEIQRKTKSDRPFHLRCLHYAIERSYDTRGILKALGWVDAQQEKNFSKYGHQLDVLVATHTKKMDLHQIAGLTNFALLFTSRLGNSMGARGANIFRTEAKRLGISIASIGNKVRADLAKTRKGVVKAMAKRPKKVGAKK